MGIQQSIDFSFLNGQSTQDAFAENSTFHLNKQRHQQLKAFYNSKGNQLDGSLFSQQEQDKFARAKIKCGSKQPNKDLKMDRCDSCVSEVGEGHEYIEDDPQHNLVRKYKLKTESADQVFQRGKGKVRYIFDESVKDQKQSIPLNRNGSLVGGTGESVNQKSEQRLESVRENKKSLNRGIQKKIAQNQKVQGQNCSLDQKPLVNSNRDQQIEVKVKSDMRPPINSNAQAIVPQQNAPQIEEQKVQQDSDLNGRSNFGNYDFHFNQASAQRLASQDVSGLEMDSNQPQQQPNNSVGPRQSGCLMPAQMGIQHHMNQKVQSSLQHQIGNSQQEAGLGRIPGQVVQRQQLVSQQKQANQLQMKEMNPAQPASSIDKRRDYQRQRRGSVAPSFSVALGSLDFKPKEIKVRTPRRGQEKKIVINNSTEAKNFPIGRLNNYDKKMKKHKGPVSVSSQLESIEDNEHEESSSRNMGDLEQPSCMGSGSLSGSGADLSKSPGLSVNDGGGNAQQSEQSNNPVVQPALQNPPSFPLKGQPPQPGPNLGGQLPQSELNKIRQAQQMRGRSMSVANNDIQKMTVKNFGHGRRSNLHSKVKQMQAQRRSNSVVIHDLQSHQAIMHAMSGARDKQSFFQNGSNPHQRYPNSQFMNPNMPNMPPNMPNMPQNMHNMPPNMMMQQNYGGYQMPMHQQHNPYGQQMMVGPMSPQQMVMMPPNHGNDPKAGDHYQMPMHQQQYMMMQQNQQQQSHQQMEQSRFMLNQQQFHANQQRQVPPQMMGHGQNYPIHNQNSQQNQVMGLIQQAFQNGSGAPPSQEQQQQIMQMLNNNSQSSGQSPAVVGQLQGLGDNGENKGFK